MRTATEPNKSDDDETATKRRREAALAVIEALRPPLPPDCRFDREEAHAR